MRLTVTMDRREKLSVLTRTPQLKNDQGVNLACYCEIRV
jgi:hypothetical protein